MKFKNRYDLYLYIVEFINKFSKDKGFGKIEVKSTDRLMDYGYDSLDALELSMDLEKALGMENLDITLSSTPEEITDEVWRIVMESV